MRMGFTEKRLRTDGQEDDRRLCRGEWDFLGKKAGQVRKDLERR